MTEKTTTQFPKMGTEVADHVALNASGARSKYTKDVPKKSGGKSVQPSGTKANRKNKNQVPGPMFRPVATLYKQNAAEASLQLRNTRLCAPATGTFGGSAFWEKRQYGQVLQ